MALQKDISFQGINLSYHKIMSINEDFRNGNTQIVVASYVNKEARLADISNMFRTVQINAQVYDLTREEIYALIKLEPGFEEAIDA